MLAVTDHAATKVKELLQAESEDDLALRIAVRPGGCSGFSYQMFFDADTEDTDVRSESSGFDIVADQTSAALLNGATLDYTDSIEQSGFKIDNPNQTAHKCGCGKSKG